MKTLLSTFLTAFALIVTAFAATLTIEIPTADVPRVSEAFGSIYNLGHNANVTEVQEITRRWIIESTKDYERRKNTYQYTPPPMEMQPSPTPTPTAGTLIAPPAPTAGDTLRVNPNNTVSKIVPSQTPTPKK